MKWTFLNVNKESERERKKRKKNGKALLARVRWELWLWDPFKCWLASKIGLEYYNPNFQFFI
jgi:hypothetical protein